jgi:hypothetical protein
MASGIRQPTRVVERPMPETGKESVANSHPHFASAMSKDIALAPFGGIAPEARRESWNKEMRDAVGAKVSSGLADTVAAN